MGRNELEIFIAFSGILLYVVVDSWEVKFRLKYVMWTQRAESGSQKSRAIADPALFAVLLRQEKVAR